tara:strand:- start:210 stop:380 length:171 start_codon:yes stop_codon:yes gene_type:complete
MINNIIEMLEKKILLKETIMDRYWDVGNHERTRKLDIEIDALKEVLRDILILTKAG